MPTFLRSPLGSRSLATLLRYNVGACLIVFALLQIWRPCYFLTDDNLSAGFPLLTEVGRHLKAGQSPFVSDYLFGGNFDLSRDVGTVLWHPFYLIPALLADTRAQFCMVELIALFFLLLTAVGFTLLAHALVREFNPALPAGCVLFYTLSFLFSSFVLMTGASWVNFLGSQSALPWLILGILQAKIVRGTALVALFTLHEILGAYAALTVTTGLLFTLFAAGVVFFRRSPVPLFSWILGNLLAVLLATPLLMRVLDGFAHSARGGGVSLQASSLYAMPAALFPFSFFFGNWTTVLAPWLGDDVLQSTHFPYASVLLACAAAWCLVPAVLGGARWRALEILCAGLVILLVVLTIRPLIVGEIMHRIPFIKSMRWPFRECLQLLFFLHLFLLIRPWGRLERWRSATFVFSALIFLLPLPFSRVPTFNPLALDRVELFSGHARAYWSRVAPLLQSPQGVATIIDWNLWQSEGGKIPFSLLNIGNFPAYFRIKSISGYDPTAPLDQRPLKTYPWYWFGAFRTEQIPDLLAEKPDLKLIEIESVDPLKISLLEHGRKIDISP